MKRIILILSILVFSFSSIQAQVRIKMKKENGVYTTPCIVNGLRLRFIFDTGASNVSISSSVATFMLKNGYLNESDLHGSSYSQIANGDIIKNTTVTLMEMEIGDIKLRNVEAIIIHGLSAPILLGQSAIQKLGKLQIEDDELVILNSDSPSSYNAYMKAIGLIEEANNYYDENLYALSADTYQSAYDLSPNALDFLSLHRMGCSYFNSDNYMLSIKYLEKSAKCMPEDKSLLMYTYLFIGWSYNRTENYELAILNAQKALSYASEDIEKYDCNINLARIYSKLKQYYKAESYYEKSVNYFLKSISFTSNDVMRGKVENAELGELYWNIFVNYSKLNQQTKADKYMIKAALCGDEQAIEHCNKYGLKYKMYIE